VENADLYTMDLPEYSQQVTSGELSVDAEATRGKKPRVQAQSSAYGPLPSPAPLPQDTDSRGEEQSLGGEYQYHIQQGVNDQGETSTTPSTNPPILTYYLAEPVATASLASVRACSILGDRPAVWLVKRKSLALSPLAAAVLTKEGLVQAKELQL
jgi:hypothetical protein